MAQAALQEELIPAGGIADFVMSDAEIAALESEETEQQFGTAGIARFEPIAKRMASYGRYGDDQVAHVETGELLVPRALIEGNPELKESIFGHLREMGIENPERYVVGSGANSINPDTGLPEFFFKSIRRAVSKVAKGVSKAVSKVGKVLKKVAPAVLPIAFAMTPLGPMYGAALGSGIGTLIQGGNIKDALKAALTAGAVGGITAGFSGKGSFFENVGNAMKNPMARLSQTGAGISKAFETGSIGEAFQSYVPPASVEATVPQTSAAETLTEVASSDVPVTTGQEVAAATDITPARFPDASGDISLPEPTQPQVPTTVTPPPPPPPPAGTETGFFDKVGEFYNEYLSPSRDMGQISLTDALKELGTTPATATAAQLEVAKGMVANAAPNMFQAYAPLAAAGTGIAAATGFFDEAPQDDPNLVDRRTGMDLIAQNPSAYMVGGRTPQYATGETVVGTQYGYAPPRMPAFMDNPFRRPQMYAAAGGEVYPRRYGGIMPNEGIPDQDSVRALLMPGEFVMTKDAVRGLGNGNLNQGINNMYSMMRNLESKGQVA
jgi:hypothetical protein